MDDHALRKDNTSEFQRRQVIPSGQSAERPEDDLDVMAWIKISVRRNGAMSVEGHLGDKKFVLAMLDNARDAVLRQVPNKGDLIVPGRDVAVPEFAPKI